MKLALFYGGLIIVIVIIITVTSCPCPAGTHCVNDGSNYCQKCGKNKYQSRHNSYAYSCDDCDVSCGQREFVVNNCTIHSNLECQCEAGFHKEGVQESVCVPHNACKAGFEEKEPGLLVFTHMSHLMGKPTMWFPNRSDTNCEADLLLCFCRCRLLVSQEAAHIKTRPT